MKAMINTDAEKLNEQQKIAALNPIDICTKIVAGAGTGKTKIISKRFVKLTKDLIEKDVENPVERLLVITFTDKAAGEMKERILKELDENGIDSTGQDLWISTIHSFCSRILRKHSIEANLSPSFKLGDEVQLKEIFDNILRRIKYNESNTIDNLNEIASGLGLSPEILSIKSVNKLRSINSLDSVLEDIYGLIKKIKSLGITPKAFLTRTLISTAEFSEVVKKLFKESFTSYADAETIYSDWEEILLDYKENNLAFNAELFKKFADAKVSDNNNERILFKFNRFPKKPNKWEIGYKLPDIITDINCLELHLTKIVAIIYAIYQNEMEKLDLVDFDDLINKTIQILKQNEVIRSFYQKHFAHLIVDEFQDTNGAQLELIELLLSKDYPNITFVGDRKQSIYSFRYAQMENLDVLASRIAQNYGKDKVDEITLVTNYRSTPEVLDAVNFVTTNELELDEKLSTERDFGEKNQPIKVSVLTGFNDAYTHKVNEAKYIASEIIRLKSENNEPYSNFAVLVKSHNQAEIISKELLKYGIPSIKKVNTAFFRSPEIKNIAAMFRLAKNLRDEIAFVRVLNIKLTESELYDFKLELDKTVNTDERLNLAEKIIFVQENNLWDKLELKETVINYAKFVTQTIFNLSRAKNKLSLIQIYYKLVNSIKPYENLSGIEQYNAELNLRVFEKIIIDYMQSESYVNVKTFLEYLEKAKDDKSFELPNLLIKDVDAVQIYTIYASKGLQFPYTFVAHITSHHKPDDSNLSFDLQYGKKPGFGLIINKYNGKNTAKSTIYKEIWKNPRRNNEDLRLFYVAVSRAEHYLNVLSFTPCGSYPASYFKEMSEAYNSEPIDTTTLEVEPQEYKPSLTLSKQKPKENVKTIESSKSEYNMSFSRVNTFSDCRAKYLFQYKYKYPKFGVKEDSSIVGSVVHNLIYTSFLNNKEFSVTEILLFLQSVQLEKQDDIKIKNLYDSFLKSDFTPSKLRGKKLFAERSFNFSTEVNGSLVNFSGDIDLLVKGDDGSYTIIDFKTNKNIEKSLGNYYKQLYLYKKALEKEGLKIKDSKIINLTLDEPKIFEIDEETILAAGEIFEQEVENLIIADIESEIIRKEQDDSCKTCGYGYLCQMNE